MSYYFNERGWDFYDREQDNYEYTVFCERDGKDFVDELDETFRDKDEAFSFKEEMEKDGWTCRVKRYDLDTFFPEGVEIKE